jgi:hypothetical protein
MKGQMKYHTVEEKIKTALMLEEQKELEFSINRILDELLYNQANQKGA